MKNEKDKLLITLFTNLKGNKKKVDNWITIANACDKLIKKYGYSKNKLSKELSVSQETIRQTLKVLENPKEVQKLVKERKIGLDVNEAISGLKNDNTKIKIAKIVSDLNAFDARYIIQYVKRNPQATIKEIESYKEKLLKSKWKSIKLNLHLLAIPLEKNDYITLKKISENKKISVQQLVTEMIKEYIKKVKI